MQKMETSLLSHLGTATTGLFALLLFIFLIKKNEHNKNQNAPPTAPGAFPIIGHLHLLAGGSEVPHVTLGALADKCGPIFTIRVGMHRAVVVSTWEIAKECYTAHDAALTSRPEFAGAKYLAYNYAMFAFSPHGAYWRDTRKIAASELLSPRRIETLGHVRVSEVEASVQKLRALWRNRKDAAGGRVLVELEKWFNDLSNNIIVRMVAGKRYDDDDDGDRIEKRRCLKALREFFQYLGISVVSDAFPFLEKLDIGGQIGKMKKTAKELDSIVSEWLEEHRRRKVSGTGSTGEGQDFMDAMITAVDGKNLGDYDDDTIIKATCLAMIAGATDTVTVALVWAVSLLLNNPHTLKKAQQELDTIVGDKRSVKESDIEKLVYLQAIVKETLRTYPPTPLLAPRELTQDCIIGGYRVTKGTRLIPNVWKIQHDPRVWPDPFEFRPERFLTGDPKDIDVVRGLHFQLFPFGSGRRGCPGAAFGVQVVHLALASFLHAFDVSSPSGAAVDMTESFGLTNMKATPLEVLIKPRVHEWF